MSSNPSLETIPTPTVVPDFPLSSITINNANPRTISAEGETALRASLERHGLVGVLVINERADGRRVLVSGHQRLKVLLAAGETTAPVIVTRLSIHDEIALGLQLNTHAGHFVEDKLQNQLAALVAAGRNVAAIGLDEEKAYKSAMDALGSLIEKSTPPPEETAAVESSDLGPVACTVGQYRFDLTAAEHQILAEKAAVAGMSKVAYAVQQVKL